MLASCLQFCPHCTTHAYESPLFEPVGRPGKPTVKLCLLCKAAWRWTGQEWVLMRGSRWSYREFADQIARQAIIAKIRAELKEEEAGRVQV